MPPFVMPPMPAELVQMLSRGLSPSVNNGAPQPGVASPVGPSNMVPGSAGPAMNSVPGAPGAFGPEAPIQMGPGGVNLRPPMAGAPPIQNAPGTNVPMASP